MSEEAVEYQEPEEVLEDRPEVEEPGPTEEQLDKASKQGWAPKDQWRGDPDKWVDADEFLDRAESNNAMLRERNDKLLGEVSALREELRTSVKQFGESTRKAEERAYKQAMADLQARQKEAVAEADTEAWEQLEQQKEGLKQDFATSQQQEVQPAPQPVDPNQDPAFLGWLPKNEWYGKDMEATVYAKQVAEFIVQRYPNGGIQNPQFYDDITNEVKKKFPNKFRNTNRDKSSAVQGSTQAGGRKKAGKGYSDLPPEAKAACDKFVSQGLMKKEDYVKEFFGE